LAPFSVEDLFALDEVVLRVQLHLGKANVADAAIFSFADFLWRRRLPIRVDELEALLNRHGVAKAPHSSEKSSSREMCLSEVSSDHRSSEDESGPFAAEKHMTAAQRELWTTLFRTPH
jgi:hypothetical protein